jgi:hypothetical protein
MMMMFSSYDSVKYYNDDCDRINNYEGILDQELQCLLVS